MTFILFLNMYLFIYLAASGLSCYMQDLVPQSGIEPGLPTQNTEFQPLDHQESSKMTFKYIVLYYNIVVVNINQVFSVCLTLV